MSSVPSSTFVKRTLKINNMYDAYWHNKTPQTAAFYLLKVPTVKFVIFLDAGRYPWNDQKALRIVVKEFYAANPINVCIHFWLETGKGRKFHERLIERRVFKACNDYHEFPMIEGSSDAKLYEELIDKGLSLTLCCELTYLNPLPPTVRPQQASSVRPPPQKTSSAPRPPPQQQFSFPTSYAGHCEEQDIAGLNEQIRCLQTEVNHLRDENRRLQAEAYQMWTHQMQAGANDMKTGHPQAEDEASDQSKADEDPCPQTEYSHPQIENHCFQAGAADALLRDMQAGTANLLSDLRRNYSNFLGDFMDQLSSAPSTSSGQRNAPFSWRK